MNVSIVSVSLLALPPQLGQEQFRQTKCRSSGFPGLSNVISFGSLIGKFSFFSGTAPHFSQCTTGMGQPQ